MNLYAIKIGNLPFIHPLHKTLYFKVVSLDMQFLCQAKKKETCIIYTQSLRFATTFFGSYDLKIFSNLIQDQGDSIGQRVKLVVNY
jgi:hypothetical protein